MPPALSSAKPKTNSKPCFVDSSTEPLGAKPMYPVLTYLPFS